MLTRNVFYLLVFSACCVCVVSAAGAEDEISPGMDTIERELETWRHTRLLEQISATDAALNEFTTDGCSGGMSLAWTQLSERYPKFQGAHGGRPPWEACCVAHDLRYHAGGEGADSATDSFEQRRAADNALKVCVVESGVERSDSLQSLYGLSASQVELLYQAIADLMYRAVRLGGIPCTEETYRWGYGWPKCRAGDHETGVSSSETPGG